MDAKIANHRAVSTFTCAALLIAAGAASACQDQKPAEPSATAWTKTAEGRDLEKICNVMKYSGAVEESPENHEYLTATYLSKNIESSATREFMISFSDKPVAQKADLLSARAASFGISVCPTALMWRGAEK
jgi:hypothetical protein